MNENPLTEKLAEIEFERGETLKRRESIKEHLLKQQEFIAAKIRNLRRSIATNGIGDNALIERAYRVALHDRARVNAMLVDLHND